MCKRQKLLYNQGMFLALQKKLHQSFVNNRRIEILSRHLAELIPEKVALVGLDVGCGSGLISESLAQRKPNLKLTGLDVLIRPGVVIPVRHCNQSSLPCRDKEADFCLLIDVLHHSEDPKQLLRECVRVGKRFILIKDHVRQNFFDGLMLRFMDWVGNRQYGTDRIDRYFSAKEWNKIFHDLNLKVVTIESSLKLYPAPFSKLFDSHLHFMVRLEKNAATAND